MQVGSYKVTSIVEGRFGLDGGAMFGIVPKPLWERSNPADERNRIELASRCLLLEGKGRVVLVDTGLGSKYDGKLTEIYKVRHPHPGGLVGVLGDRGIEPEEVTDVVFTHLHFDHCGGTTHEVGGELRLTFPEAIHHVQERNWSWAHRPTQKDAGSYRREDFAPLEESDRLRLVDGDIEVLPGIHVHVVEGHTPAMQLVRVGDDAGATVLFLADLVPTRTHLKWPYIMAYDNQPLSTLAEKREILPQAAAGGWTVVFEHDPECAAARLRSEGDAVVVDRAIEL